MKELSESAAAKLFPASATELAQWAISNKGRVSLDEPQYRLVDKLASDLMKQIGCAGRAVPSLRSCRNSCAGVTKSF